MRKLVGLLSIALLAGATSVYAAPPPGIEQCPEDVAAALASQCPCDGPGQAWKNHGKYVSCVVRYRNALRKAGCLTDEAKRTIASCAARSTCGKEGAVLCCVYDTSGVCSGDSVPGDAVAEGLCTDGVTACDTDVDCIVATGPPRVSRTEEKCTDRGGTAVGGGSVCSDCPLPPPAPAP